MWTTTAIGDTSRSNHVKYVWNNSYHITFIIHNPVEAPIFFYQASSFQLLKLENLLQWSFFTFVQINQSINLSINQSHRTSWRHDWPRGLGALNSSPLSGLFTSVSVGSSTRFYRFTSATGRIGVYTALKYDKKTYPISDTPLLRSAWRSVAPSQNSSPPQPLCGNRSPIEYCRYLIFSYLIIYLCTRERSACQYSLTKKTIVR